MNTLIIGGSKCLGEKMALSFAPLSDNLVLLARSERDLIKVKEQISTQTKIHLFLCDLSDVDQIQSTIKMINSCMPSIDVVLNVAGGAYIGGTNECEVIDFCQMIDAYIRGQSLMLKALIPNFRKTGNTLIVNFLADWAKRKAGLECGNAIYCTTKSALANFTDCLISEEHRYGLRATNIFLGEISDAPSLQELERDEMGRSRTLFMQNICDFVVNLVTSPSLHVSDITLVPQDPGYARRHNHVQCDSWDV